MPDNIPPMPTVPPPNGYQYGLTVGPPLYIGGPASYKWELLQTPKSLLSQSSAGNAVGLDRNALDATHYGRQDAMQALRDAADAAYQRGQLADTTYGDQSRAGQALLDSVIKLMQDPTAGPLGLTAFAKYGGGAQNIASGTNGAGIANPNASLLDDLLQHLKGSVTSDSNVFNRLNAGNNPSNLYAAAGAAPAPTGAAPAPTGAAPAPTGAAPAPASAADTLLPADPNKAPMMTPESAADAPLTEAQKWIKAWEAYNPGQTYGVDPSLPTNPNTPLSDGPNGLLTQARQSPLWNGNIPGLPPMNYAGGGEQGLTIGGQKHFIVGADGKIVANLTEDGKPETVKPLAEGAGVEVVPEDPARKAVYLQAKQSGQLIGKLLGAVLYPTTAGAAGAGSQPATTVAAPAAPTATATAAPVGLADGGAALFPFPAPLGFGEGGPSQDRQTTIGNYFKPNSPTDLPAEATAPDFQTRLTGYAKLLGGALSAGNQAVPTDALQALNAGKAPKQLLSANALSTLMPSQKSNYYALLQQMGLGSPQDIEEQIKRFTPTSIGGTSVAGGAFA